MRRIGIILTVLSLASSVQAGPLLTHILDTPPMDIVSTYRNDRFDNIESATFEVFTLGHNSNRVIIAGTLNSVNMELVLTCPGGQTWHHSQVGGRPYLSVVPQGNRGWCTLVVTHRFGNQEHRDFGFSYERRRLPRIITNLQGVRQDVSPDLPMGSGD